MRNNGIGNTGRKTVINGVLLGLFIGFGMLFFIDFSSQPMPLSISNLFITPIPVLVGILVYLTVMGTRKVIDDE